MIKVDKKNKIILEIDDNIFLKILTKDDITSDYINWMNDYDIVKYTNQKNIKHTFKNVTNFVENKYYSNNDYLFGIFNNINGNKLHIGNIKIGPIDFINNVSDISYIIGNKNYWGKGIMTKVIKEIIKFSFNVIKLDRLKASTYKNNIGSIKALNNNNFIENERIISELIFEGKKTDKLIFILFKN